MHPMQAGRRHHRSFPRRVALPPRGSRPPLKALKGLTRLTVRSLILAVEPSGSVFLVSTMVTFVRVTGVPLCPKEA